jgi:membrane protease YdiL (CAAX protease family)
MAAVVERKPAAHAVGPGEWVFFAWVAAALALLWPVSQLVGGSLPVFTIVWLGVPLAAVLVWRDASQVGFRAVPLLEVAKVTGITLAGLALVTVAVEPWTGAYTRLVSMALGGNDATFRWLVAFDGFTGWAGFVLFTLLVTIFAEELFFRGWLLNWLRGHMPVAWALVVQAGLFTVPQVLAALLMPPLQGVVYAAAYAFVGIGLIGGWAAARTRSIWPSLIAAVVLNAVLTALAVATT